MCVFDAYGTVYNSLYALCRVNPDKIVFQTTNNGIQSLKLTQAQCPMQPHLLRFNTRKTLLIDSGGELYAAARDPKVLKRLTALFTQKSRTDFSSNAASNGPALPISA